MQQEESLISLCFPPQETVGVLFFCKDEWNGCRLYEIQYVKMSSVYVEIAQVYDKLTKRLFFLLFDKDLHKKRKNRVNNVNNLVNNPLFKEIFKEKYVNNFLLYYLCQIVLESEKL